MEIWSFFTGGMGLDLGLEQAGLAPSLVNEVNPVFCSTIRRNRPHVTLIEGDISRLTREDLKRARGLRKGRPDVHLFVGGPPCQSFSSGGKRTALTDPRGNLIYQYLRLIGEVRPAYFVLENVANLATAALRHRPIVERPGQHWSLKTYDTQWQNGDEQFSPLEADERASSALRQILKHVDKLKYSVRFGIVDAADYGSPQHRLRFVMYGARDGDWVVSG